MIKREAEEAVLPSATDQPVPDVFTPQTTPTSSQSTDNSDSIKTLVFFHVKATSLPANTNNISVLKKSQSPAEFKQGLINNMLLYREANCPRLTELSFVAVPRQLFEKSIAKTREIFEKNEQSFMHDLHTTKLTLQFNIEITEEQSQQSYQELGECSPIKRARYARQTFHPDKRETFRTQWPLIQSFLSCLPKPAVLVSHCAIGYHLPVLFGELKRNSLSREQTPLLFVDSFYLCSQLEDKFHKQIRDILMFKYNAPGCSPPVKHPWLYLKDGGAPIALLKRSPAEKFRKNADQPWTLSEECSNSNQRLQHYNSITGVSRDFNFAEENALALLQSETGTTKTDQNISAQALSLHEFSGIRTYKSIIFFSAKTTGPFTDDSDVPITIHAEWDKVQLAQDFKHRYLNSPTEVFPKIVEMGVTVISIEEFGLKQGLMMDQAAKTSRRELGEYGKIPHIQCKTKTMTKLVNPFMTNEEWKMYEERARDHPEEHLPPKDKLVTKKPFNHKWHAIRTYLKQVPKPAFFVAHNGFHREFRVLFRELKRYDLLVDKAIPTGIGFVDSMFVIKRIEMSFKYALNIVLKMQQDQLEEDRPYVGRDSPPNHPLRTLYPDWTGCVAFFKRTKSEDFTKHCYLQWSYELTPKAYDISSLWTDIFEEAVPCSKTIMETNHVLLQIALSYGKFFKNSSARQVTKLSL